MALYIVHTSALNCNAVWVGWLGVFKRCMPQDLFISAKRNFLFEQLTVIFVAVPNGKRIYWLAKLQLHSIFLHQSTGFRERREHTY